MKCRKGNIKSKLFNYILYLIVVMTGLSGYLAVNTHKIINEYNKMLSKFILLNDLSQSMLEAGKNFENYFSTRTMNDMEKFYDSYNKVIKYKDMVKHLIKDEEGKKDLNDIENLINGYRDESYKAIDSSNSDEIGNFYTHYVQANIIENYTETHIRQLIKHELDISSDTYTKLNHMAFLTEVIIFGAVILIGVFFILYSSNFFQYITEPIIKLSAISRELSAGNFDVEKVEVKSDDELKDLADGFNIMVDNIKKLIREIEENAKFREKLKDEEMKNLLMSKALKDEQLKALQAQINPHFLFNTLNAIVKTAILENASETENLIQCLSDILRYTLRKSVNPSTIREEIHVVSQYMFIQKTRFQNRLNFILDVDEQLYDNMLPSLTLQPLIENAFIHGIDGREDGGEIRVEVKDGDDCILIEVRDNGNGIPEEKLVKLKSFDDQSSEDIKRGHVTGLGINNVVQRLKLYFKNDVDFDIQSVYGSGTSIFIKIPKVLEG